MNTRSLKQAAKAAMASPLGWRMSAPSRRRGVVVLAYHRITDGPTPFDGLPLSLFREQMAWIRRQCTPVWPEEIFDAARRADRIRPPVVVTFDDGYRDYHDRAYPVLQELKIPATVFVSTDFMDHGGLLWTEQVGWAAAMTKKTEARLPWDESHVHSLRNTEERSRFAQACKAHLKALPDAERRAALDLLLAQLEAGDAEAALGRQMLSWDEVRATREGTRYGGHSHTHPILSRLGPEEMEYEIRTCRDRIAAETGEAPRTFAYPNGRPPDFNELTRELLRKHGFEIAFSTVEGINGPDADAFALRRQPSGGSSVGDFAAIVARA